MKRFLIRNRYMYLIGYNHMVHIFLCSARHHCQFDMPHDYVGFFLTPCAPQGPKVPPLGHDPGERIKIPFDMFYIFHLLEHTQSLV